MTCFLGSCNRSGGSWFGFVLIGALVVLAGVKLVQSRPAETPAVVVNAGLTLDDALDRSIAEGKPVLAFVTAKWCGSCQSLKRNGLKDPAVLALIESRTIAVTLEETTPEGAKGIRQLTIEAYPTLLLIENGMVRSKIVGAQSAGSLVAWLEANTTAPASNDAPAEG
ncbi:MAG: thiol:disulfide interchange protein [Phycisphaerales bacterium]|jgi:thiol:disulfide interchange protein